MRNLHVRAGRSGGVHFGLGKERVPRNKERFRDWADQRREIASHKDKALRFRPSFERILDSAFSDTPVDMIAVFMSASADRKARAPRLPSFALSSRLQRPRSYSQPPEPLLGNSAS